MRKSCCTRYRSGACRLQVDTGKSHIGFRCIKGLARISTENRGPRYADRLPSQLTVGMASRITDDEEAARDYVF